MPRVSVRSRDDSGGKTIGWEMVGGEGFEPPTFSV